MPMVNPHEPFVAEDGLVYEDLAARILGEPDKSWRNDQVRGLRAAGTPETDVRRWIKLFDGDEPPVTQAQFLARDAAKRDARFIDSVEATRYTHLF